MSKKFKFKVGDRVLVSRSAFKDVEKQSATVIALREDDYVVEFDNREFGWEDSRYNTNSGWYVLEEDLSYLHYDSIVVSKTDMKKIYDIACDEWKSKINDLFADIWSDSVRLTESMCRDMIKASTKSQKPIVEKVLYDSGYKSDSKKYINFGESYTISTSSVDDGLFIRHGLANDDFEDMEIGLLDGYTIELYNKDGDCFSLTAENDRDVYFRIKK